MSTKNKTIVLVMGVMLMAFSILVGTVYVNQKHKLRDVQREYYDNVKTSYEKILKQRDRFYLNRAMANLESAGVKEAIRAHDRQRLYELSLGRWETLRKENPELTVMHFHLPGGQSLLRMHDPEHYGDPIAQKRPMVVQVHRERRALHGFEIGDADLAYRTIVPIMDGTTYLGALEFGAKPDDLLQEMGYFNDIYGALFVKNDVAATAGEKGALTLGGYRLQFQTLKKGELIADLKTRGFDFAPFQTRVVNGRTYGVYTFDLHDFQGRVTARTVFFQDITDLVNGFRQTLLDLLVLLFLLMSAVLWIIDFGFQRILSVLDRTKDELQENKDFLQSLFESSKDGIALTDLQSRFLYFNDAFRIMTGYTDEELRKRSCLGLSASENLARMIKAIDEVKQTGCLENFEQTCTTKEGGWIVVNLSIVLMPDRERLLMTTKNVTEAKKLENRLKEYVRLVDENVITSTTDLYGNITYVSEAFCKISGYQNDELLGRNHRIVRHPDMDGEVYTELWKTIASGNVWEGEIKNRKKDGGFYWVLARIYPVYDENHRQTGYTAIRQDITDKKRIEEISITDGLTGIYNRRYFNEKLPRIIAGARRKDETVCMMVMDVDFFKLYNDTYGHLEGDEVLIQVASVLRSSLRRPGDYCFRLGGEEFGVLFQAEEETAAFGFADRIRAAVEALKIPHQKNVASEFVTVSIGVACAAGASIENGDALYREADQWLYEAKEGGRNRVGGPAAPWVR